VQRPVRELGSLRGVRRDLAPFRLDGQTPLTTVERDGPARHVVLTIDAGQGGGFRLLFRSQDRTDLTIAADLGAGTLTIDRGPVASLPRFDARTTAPMIRTSDLIRIELVLDRGSVEVFICDGLNMISERLLPSDGAYSVFLAGDDTVECMGGTVWNLTPV